MLKSAFLLFVIGFSISVYAQELRGYWEGTMIRDGSELSVYFEFEKDKEGFKGNFNAPTMSALKIPFQAVNHSVLNAHFELRGDSSTIVFNGEIKNGTLSGKFQEGKAFGTFMLKLGKPPKPVFTQEEVRFKNGETTLAGTLVLPLTKVRHPAIVFLHGAGPESRYGSRFLAEQAARKGIAALIYDKRGVGDSKGRSWTMSDFEDLAKDAAAGIDFLKIRREIDPKQIGLYGHSNGGFIAPLVAAFSKDVSFIIAGASYGGVAWEQDIYRVRNSIATQNFSEKQIEHALDYYSQFVTVARTGEGWDSFQAKRKRPQREMVRMARHSSKGKLDIRLV